MVRTLLACWTILTMAGLAAAQPRPQPPRKLLLSANKPPTPALRLTLLPELRDQEPGDAWPLYQKASELLKKLPVFQDLPRDQAPHVLEIYREPLALVERASRRERCNCDYPERIRKAGVNATLPELQQLRQAIQVLIFKARHELAQDQPEKALRTLQVAYSIGQRTGDFSTLLSLLVGVAITAQTNDALLEVLSHPKTPNLYWSLTTLPRPFIPLRRAMESERLWVYGTFPPLQAVARDPDAGPIPGEELRQIFKDTLMLQGRPDNYAVRLLLAQQVRNQHETAKQALIATGRPRDKVDSWPPLQVALLYGVLDYEKHMDEIKKWEAEPYHQAAAGLREAARSAPSPRTLPLGQPAFSLAAAALPTIETVVLARERLERQFAALRCVEAIRLHAAEHGGKLPASLADVNEVPLPLCPVTGKPFEYRLQGASALLSAPEVPAQVRRRLPPLAYEITIRR
jgi:hypothetical protein